MKFTKNEAKVFNAVLNVCADDAYANSKDVKDRTGIERDTVKEIFKSLVEKGKIIKIKIEEDRYRLDESGETPRVVSYLKTVVGHIPVTPRNKNGEGFICDDWPGEEEFNSWLIPA
tara:strand:+ start:507 stop:854 length:348 start_codon:yes stop_codon:yes gene_type:complete